MRAELGNAEKALALLDNQLRLCDVSDEICYSGGGGVYPNMLAAHPPFQIDANFGAAAGIVNMLIRSQDGEILVFPALPDRWKKGSIKGLRAVGNVYADIEWENGKAYVSLMAENNALIKIKIWNETRQVKLLKNKKTTVKFIKQDVSK